MENRNFYISRKKGIFFLIFLFIILVLVLIFANKYIISLDQMKLIYLILLINLSILLIVFFIFLIYRRYSFYEKKGFFSSKVNLFEVILILILISSSFAFAGILYSVSILISIFIFSFSCLFGLFILWKSYELEKICPNKWSIGIYKSKSPLTLTGNGTSNPVISFKEVNDINAKFVADPFLIQEKEKYYLFFEAFNSKTEKGEIALATSVDAVNWSYEKIILKEKFHLSYPHVFKWKEEYYMLPETGKIKSLRLYKAREFPYQWDFVKEILHGKEFMDSTIFYYANLWWLFTETKNNSVLKLYYSDTPLGPWKEHKKSPIVDGDSSIARPAGNVVFYNKEIIRFAQDDESNYGNQVWAFEITKLTKEDYEEKRIGNKPILKGCEKWNKRGMHHISAIKDKKGEWIASVDGY
ncbi:MAG: hypothetical protein WC584_00125 [Candidatus Pacearchaeota archaeon]